MEKIGLLILASVVVIVFGTIAADLANRWRSIDDAEREEEL